MPSDKKEDFDCSFNVILWEGNKLRAQFLHGEGVETRLSFSISHRMIYLYVSLRYTKKYRMFRWRSLKLYLCSNRFTNARMHIG